VLKTGLANPLRRLLRSKGLLSSAQSASVAAGSMILGLVQLIMLLRLGTGQATDAYFYVLAWNVVPIQLVLVSFYYPLLLRSGSLNTKLRNRVGIIAGLSTAGASLLATILYSRIAGTFSGLILQSTIGTIGTVISVGVWMLALGHAAEGSPNWLAGVNLLPSVFAVFLLGVFGDSSSIADNVAWMLSGQCVGFVTYLVLMWAAREPHQNSPKADDRDPSPSKTTGASWIAGQSIAAYGSILLLQTLTATLPASSLTTLGLATRIVSAVSTLVSSSILPIILNVKTTTGHLAVRFLWVMLGLESGAFLALIMNPFDMLGQYRQILMIISVWSLGVILNLTLHRLAFRLHDSRSSLITIVVCVGVSAWAACWTIAGLANLQSVLCALIALDLLSGVLFAMYMKRNRLALAYTICAAAQSFLIWS
jgi:hypothetical protein